VLEALVEDASALQQHKPAQYKLLADDIPAALAEVQAAAAEAQAQGWQGSSDTNLMSWQDSITTTRAASVPLAAAFARQGSFKHHGPTAISASHSFVTAHATSGPAAAAAASGDKPFGMRSFMRSRTVSSSDGMCCSSKGGGSQAEAWGRCVSAGLQVQHHKPLVGPVNPTGPQGTGSGAKGPASEAAAATPKQSAAAKLFEALGIGKKGREAEEKAETTVAAAAAVAAHHPDGRTTGSGDYSYVLLDS